MKKLKICVLFIFIFCAALTARAQNECAAVFEKAELPAANLIIAEIRQVFRYETEEFPLYEIAFKQFYNYEYCMRPQSSNVPAVLTAVKKQTKDRFIKHLDLKPENAESSVILAQIEFLDGARQKAEKLVDEALSLDNKNFEAYFIKGFINYKTETGLRNVEEAIRLSNDFAAAHALKTEILLNLAGKSTTPDEQKAYYEQALKSAQKYLQLAPSFSRYTNFWRGQIEAVKTVLDAFERRQKNTPPSQPTPPPAETSTILKLKTKPRADYTELARMSNTQGTVRVRVWFGADGQVKNVLIMQSLPFGLNYQAVIAAKLIEFEPATRDGKPYPVIKTVEYMFTLY